MGQRRARALAMLLGAALVVAATIPSQGAVEGATEEGWATVPALRDVSPWPVGVAIDGREMTGTGSAVVTRHFDQITAENAMKPAYIWRDPAKTSWVEWDWGSADAYVDFARDNGLRVYGHTLIWHQQMPPWFYQRADGTPYWNATGRRCADVTDADRDLLRWRIATYIHGVADHFRSRYGDFGTPGNPIVAFDVVNEAIDNTADHFRQVENPLYCVLGTSYLEFALRTADEAFRSADGSRSLLLFINDYNTEWSWKSDDQLAVVRDLLDRGVPLDGVGHQLHLSLDDRSAVLQEANLRRTLDQIAATGLQQAVTELDVGLPVGLSGTDLDRRLAEQGDYFGDLFTLFRGYDLFSVSVWGPHDGRTWRTGTRPLLFDESYGVKPAFHGASERAPSLLVDLPPSRTVGEGEPVELAIEPDASPAPTVTWEVRHAGSATWSAVASGDSTRYRFDAVLADDGSEVRAVVVNRRGRVVSESLRLAVLPMQQVRSIVPPLIAGTTAVGRTLSASAGTWDPAPSHLAYQWLRDGRPVPGANLPTYLLVAGDVGTRVSVRVTATRAGHADGTATSTAPAPVTRARTSLRIAAPRTTEPRRTVLVRVTVSAPGVTPSGVVALRDSGEIIRTVRLRAGSAVARLRLRKPGKHRLIATYAGTASTTSSRAGTTIVVRR